MDNKGSDLTAQADLSLHWTHMPQGTFSHVEAHIVLNLPSRHTTLKQRHSTLFQRWVPAGLVCTRMLYSENRFKLVTLSPSDRCI